MPDTPSGPSPKPVQKRRYKVPIACNTCRARKLKCDGIRPVCGRCQTKSHLRGSCFYASGRLAPAAPAPPQPSTSAPGLPAQPLGTTPHLAPFSPVQGADAEAHHGYHRSSTGEFISNVKAAIDARLAPGKPTSRKSCQLPMTDFPLFGSVPPLTPEGDGNTLAQASVLPPRKQADHLLSIFWRGYHTLEPLLDKPAFCRAYRALYNGTDPGVDERTFLSTLNAVFALATQIQESKPHREREPAAMAFFLRAWSLLKPESILWEPGTLEMVQCLLLISRFSQCTSSPHRTWMVAGIAVRMALGLGIHAPGPQTTEPPQDDGWLRRQVWLACVCIDRELSWAFGRTSMIPLAVSVPTRSTPENGTQLAVYAAKTLELHEITGYTMLSQMSSGSRFAEELGLPQIWQTDLNVAVQIDACVRKWEKNLPAFLRPGIELESTDLDTKRQRVSIQIRVAHTRSLLCRPMLAHFCLPQYYHSSRPPPSDQSLAFRVLHDCASLCLEASRDLISIIEENYDPAAETGLIRWWNRIYYLYVASQHLVAAMLRPDMFGTMPSEYLNKALAMMQAHEHLCPSIVSCVRNFQTQAQTVSSMHSTGRGDTAADAEEGNPVETASVQGVMQDINLDAENWLLGMEDMSWLMTDDWAS